LLGWHERKQYKELGDLDRLRELLRQTAEEAVELAQAALKVIRAAKGTTPLDGEDAVDMLGADDFAPLDDSDVPF